MNKRLIIITVIFLLATAVAYFANAAGVVFFRGTADQTVVTFTNVGTTNWTVPEGVSSVEVLVVAGGGGSGGSGNTGYYGGGGGGGGLIYESSFTVTPSETISVTVGDGGLAGVQVGDAGYPGGNGGNSSFGSLVAIGGGGGGGNSANNRAGTLGGSGGGGSLYSGLGGAGTAGQGKVGGRVYGQCGAGGGGAGSAGGDGLGTAYVNGFGGSGGSGLAYSISGSTVYYAGGGAARGMTSNGSASEGATPIDTAGAANTGAGGGGTHRAAGKAGGSGIVIVRYGKPKAVASSIQKGLVGHWPLDGDNYNAATGRTTDKTPHSNNGTNYGATLTTDRNGQSNGAMSFDGVNDYVNAGNAASLNLTNVGTLAAWIKVGQYTIYPSVVGKGASAGWDTDGYGIELFPGNVVKGFICNRSQVPNNRSVTFGSPAVDTWHHYVLKWDGTYLYAYFDGVEVQKVTQTFAVPVTAYDFLIGRLSGYFNGSVADVRVYNRAISEDEVKMLYGANKPKIVSDSLQRGLIFDMPLTSDYTKTVTAGSQIMTDRTPYSNVGQNYGGTVSSEGTSFNGSQYIGNIDINDPGLFEPASITVSSWINMDTDASTARHIWFTKWYGYSSEIAATTRIPYFRLNGPGDIMSNTAITLGQWHHFVGTYDPAIGGRVYLDGIQVGTKAPSGAILHSRNFPLNIGRYSGGIYFKGKISNARIYNRALSATEVKSLYDRGRK